MDILGFWGKARPRDPDRGPQWHPLAFHSLDVVAVGEALLTRHRGLSDHLQRLLGLRRDEVVRLVCFLLCLHDIGKFAKKFQAKAPKRYPACFGDDPAEVPVRYDHGAGALRLFDADPDLFDLPRAWRSIVSAIAGHHGAPPEPRIPKDSPRYGRTTAGRGSSPPSGSSNRRESYSVRRQRWASIRDGRDERHSS